MQVPSAQDLSGLREKSIDTKLGWSGLCIQIELHFVISQGRIHEIKIKNKIRLNRNGLQEILLNTLDCTI